MHVSELEALSDRLQQLQQRLRSARLWPDMPLDEGNEFVRAAEDCEFMLPDPLTAGTLADTVEHKIETVSVLLERARKHESLPESIQIIAEHEYTATGEDLVVGLQESDTAQRPSANR